jgi:mRNA interferase RelE/StbE
MNWHINISTKAAKALAKLNVTERDRIWDFIKNKLPNMQNPRTTGKALQGEFKGLWRYRVGDYRLICEIRENELVILVLEIGHRKNIYN